MSEPLKWTLELDSKLDGATAFSRKLQEVEQHLGHTEVATSKTERKLEDAGHAGARMGREVADASQKYVSSLMAAGVPLERLDKLGKVLHGAEQGLGDVAKAHHAGAHAAGEHASKTHEASGAFNEFRNVMRDATKIVGFRELSKAIDETKHSYSGLLEFGVGVIAFEGIKTAIELVTELGGEIMKAAAQEERMGKVFELTLGVKGGKEAQEYAEKYAKNTEFSKEQTEAFATELLKAGVPLEKLDLYMAAAGDVAAKSKNPVEGMAAAVTAFSRSSLTGKIGGRQVLGLGIGLPYMKELQEFRGKSDEELKGILEDGELTTNQVMRMIAGRDGMVGDHAVDMGKTMAATLTHIGELPDRYFEKFADSPAFGKMKGALGNVLSALDPNGPQGSQIFGALSVAATGLVDQIAKVDFKEVATEIAGIAKTASEIDWVSGVKTMVKLLEIGLTTVHGIGIAMDKVASLFGGDDKQVERKAIQATAEGRVPAEIRRAAVKESGEVPGAPETAEIARRDADTTRRQRENRNSFRHLANHLPFVNLADEAPTATEAYQERMAQEMRRSEAEGPQLPKDRVATPIKKAAQGAEYLTPYFESAGQDAVSGYGRGLLAGADEASKAGMSMAQSALDGTAKAQESRSPSRKFARLGSYAADGYVDGIDDGADDATSAGKGLGVAALDGLPAESARGGRFTDSSLAVPLFSPAAAAAPEVSASPAAPVERKIEINVTVPINMPAGARTREVDDMIAKLRAMLPGTLQAAVESLAIEGGV